MDLSTALSPELQTFLTGAAGGTLANLGADFATRLLGAAGRSVRGRFAGDERTEALQRASGQAILAAVKDWDVLPDVYESIWSRCHEWLVEPLVLNEFRKLLSPTPDVTLDYETLQDEFDAVGLDVAELGKPHFDALVQDMVGAFYLAAADEPALREPIQINVLRQVAEEMNALFRLQTEEVALSRRSLGQLERLNAVADSVADGLTEAVELLRDILASIEELPQALGDQQLVYQTVAAVLSWADLGYLIDARIGDDAQNVAIGRDITITNEVSPDYLDAITELNALPGPHHL